MFIAGNYGRRWRLLAGATAGAGLLLSTSIFLLRPIAEAERSSADAGDPALVAAGERIYAAHCAACHGAELEGAPDWRSPGAGGRLPAPPHDETGHTWHHPDEMLFWITRDGVSAVVPGHESDMPAFAEILSDEEIWAVLAFIKSRWPDDIRRHHDIVNEAAAEARR